MQELLLGSMGAQTMSTWSLIAGASGAVMAVMAILALMSIFCWYIIGFKFLFLKRASKESALFGDSFWRSKDIEQIYKNAQALKNSPISAMFLAGYTELAKLSADDPATRDRDSDLENVQRALRKAQTAETTKLESMIPFLATTGSAAPFIGLLGTVWGILLVFQSIQPDQAIKLGEIAPQIGEALVATAVGLIAAIPAVMAYNYFTRRITVLISEMENFEHDYLNIIRRHFLS
jgi:biopolymer transport protein TolQ